MHLSDKLWWNGKTVAYEETPDFEVYLRAEPLKQIGIKVKPLKWKIDGADMVSGPYQIKPSEGGFVTLYIGQEISSKGNKMLAMAAADQHNEKYILSHIDLSKWKRKEG